MAKERLQSRFPKKTPKKLRQNYKNITNHQYGYVKL